MRTSLFFETAMIILFLLGTSAALQCRTTQQTDPIPLPDPDLKGKTSLETTLDNRRSHREYRDAPLSLKTLGQILWAAQGINEKHPRPPAYWGDRPWPGGLRTAPSAGALYPLDIYAAVGNVDDVPAGIYRYLPGKHALELTAEGDRRKELARAALNQPPVENGAAVVIISGVYARCAAKYGDRAQRYTHIETGHVGQNIYLQAESLGLGTVMVGAFNDRQVQSVLDLSREEIPLALMPIGHKVH